MAEAAVWDLVRILDGCSLIFKLMSDGVEVLITHLDFTTHIPSHLRCMDCQIPTKIDKVTQFGKKHKCHLCHSAYRYLSQNMDGWKEKTPEPWF